MRETSVYLMAEATGNEATRQLYKQKLQRYVWALYHIGMGEWDSETYHGHTFAPYLNLYDFAQDPQIKQLAQAALDWLSVAAAVKYYRGGWAGPVKRDYGRANVIFGSPAARTFWLYFGEISSNPDPSTDSLYLMTSSYRPPLAALFLARKQFPRPLELHASKPLYQNWLPGNDRQPGYWETTFFGETYQMGSIAATFADGDVAPFKLLAYNSRRGVDYLVANSRKRASWVQSGKNPGDQVGQFRNLLIWLRPADGTPFFFQLPKQAPLEKDGNIWFARLERTWLALYPLNLSEPEPLAIADQKLAAHYRQEQTYRAVTQGGGYAGFALEVGEAGIDGDYERFKASVRQKSHLDLSQLAQGSVRLQGNQGASLQLRHNPKNLLPILVRNGQPWDWSKQLALYASPAATAPPLSLGWKQGALTVKAGGRRFQSRYPNK
ncbi:MAG: hypothetical protein HC890_02445 [Chloroflexaceae bacterium]|nr:hypothetical protein [Chloroflexaceae bacterium]